MISGLASHPEGSSITPSCLMLQKPKVNAENRKSVGLKRLYSKGLINSNSVTEEGMSNYGVKHTNCSISQIYFSLRVLFSHSKHFIEPVNHRNVIYIVFILQCYFKAMVHNNVFPAFIISLHTRDDNGKRANLPYRL